MNLLDLARSALTERTEGTQDRPHYRWLIVDPDGGGRRELCCLPEMTAAELATCYPGARIVPLPESAAAAKSLIHEWTRIEARAVVAR